jgi:hypothetical protein
MVKKSLYLFEYSSSGVGGTCPAHLSFRLSRDMHVPFGMFKAYETFKTAEGAPPLKATLALL